MTLLPFLHSNFGCLCFLINSVHNQQSIPNPSRSQKEMVRRPLIQLRCLGFDVLNELCIKYEDTPYLQKLPTNGSDEIITASDRSLVEPVSEYNHILSIALEVDTHKINLEEKIGNEYPITLY